MPIPHRRETDWPAPLPEHVEDFSVIVGGPFYQMLVRSRLSGDALEHVRRRLILLPLIAWLPLFVLSVVTGHAWGDASVLPFLKNLAVHLRFLVALPLLVLAELVVHHRMRPMIQMFRERRLISPSSRTEFDRAIVSALALRNSRMAEALLLVFVYLVGVPFVWRMFGTLNETTWYATPTASGLHLSVPGWWFLGVSLPLFQFLAYRWYFRLFIWTRFLWQVSRCRLTLIPTHPDRSCGIGFLARTVTAFTPLSVAHGVLLSGAIADRIFLHGSKLPDFRWEIATVVGFLFLILLGPLLLFVRQLLNAQRLGMREYGALAERYMREFDAKWLRGGAPPNEPLLGSPDIQSLADLSNGYDIIRTVRVIPISRQILWQLALAPLLPIAPLLLTMMPLDQIVRHLAQVLI